MPPKRRVYRKKKSARVSTTRKIARQEAKKVVMRTSETKTWDGQIPITTVLGTAGFTYNLLANPRLGTTLTQGSANERYIGESITPVYLLLRWNFLCADAFDTLRMVIVQVKGDWTPTPGQIFTQVNSELAVISPLDTDSVNRMRVIYDRMFIANAAGPQAVCGTVRIPMKKMRTVHFKDGIGTYENGGLYACVISDSLIASDPPLRMSWRFYYKDS